MKAYIHVQEEGRVVGIATTRSMEQEIEVEVVEDHEVLRNPLVFRYQRKQLVRDNVYEALLIKERQQRLSKPSLEERLTLVQKALDDMIMGGMS
jgi:hypothetical protein